MLRMCAPRVNDEFSEILFYIALTFLQIINIQLIINIQ